MTRLQRRRVRLLLISGLFVVGFVGGGTFGVVRYIQTFWLYRGYGAPVHVAQVLVGKGSKAHEVSVTPGTVESFDITSAALGGFRDQVLVYLPPHYGEDVSTRYPVLYLLHGSPGDPQNFINVGDVSTTADQLIATGQMAPMLIVMPTGGRSFFADEEWANVLPKGNDWATFVASELVRTIDARFRTIATGRDRGIGGYSEGAYGALNISFHHLGEFDFIEGWSPYYTADIRNRTLFERHTELIDSNSPDYEVNVVAPELRANHVYIWLYGGTTDYTNRGSVAFAATLKLDGVAHNFTVHPGNHTWKLWRAMMPTALLTASNYFLHGQPSA